MSITLIILLVTCGLSILANSNRSYFARLEYNPFLVHHRKQWYRLITGAFIHAGWLHLFVNMYVFFSFGKFVEAYYGVVFETRGMFYFVLLYLGGILFSALPAFRKHRNNPQYNAVGASGAVSAILFAAIVFDPMSKIFFFFIPFGIPAFVFGILYLVFEVYMDKRSNDNIAHDAHFWGAVFGVVFTIALEPWIAVNFIEQIFF